MEVDDVRKKSLLWVTAAEAIFTTTQGAIDSFQSPELLMIINCLKVLTTAVLSAAATLPSNSSVVVE